MNLVLTKSDEKRIKEIVREEIQEQVNPKFEDVKKEIEIVEINTKLEIDKFRVEFNEKISLLPTKDEFFNWMDKLYTQVLATNQELEFTRARISRAEGNITGNSKRINTLENNVMNLQKHVGF